MAVPAHYPKLILSPDERRRRLYAVVLDWLLSASTREPFVFVVEDLHWVDPSTLELVQMLAEQAAHAPLLVVCTGRPEFSPPWAARAHHRQLELARLSSADTRTLVRSTTTYSTLSADAIEALIERSDGVPFTSQHQHEHACAAAGRHRQRFHFQYGALDTPKCVSGESDEPDRSNCRNDAGSQRHADRRCCTKNASEAAKGHTLQPSAA
jgi:hypothetical protein